MLISNPKIAIIGLGYVGLPLAVEFAKKYPVMGFDIDAHRIAHLNALEDHTGEANLRALSAVLAMSEELGLTLTHTLSDVAACNVFVITVPTPVDAEKRPDLSALLHATRAVGGLLKKNDVVIYESTVYPGCTEEDCVPILAAVSGLTFNVDFFCGYSPERINPGDKVHSLVNIMKITSGSTPETAIAINQLYASIISAGTYLAPSIRVAEAAKAIENAQRDINISFVNELALIFDKMGIDTNDVLDAAATKWNFLHFKPGLVGGHCIGVDPYYLSYKAEKLGYLPRVILSGREVNDQMAQFVVNKCVKLMIQKNVQPKGSRALVLGLSFKENCPDIRNSKALDIVYELEQFGIEVEVFDPLVVKSDIPRQYTIKFVDNIAPQTYQLIILAVAHTKFLSIDFGSLKMSETILFDTRSVLNRNWVDARL